MKRKYCIGKQLVAWLLMIVFCFSLLPFHGYAEDDEDTEVAAEDDEEQICSVVSSGEPCSNDVNTMPGVIDAAEARPETDTQHEDGLEENTDPVLSQEEIEENVPVSDLQVEATTAATDPKVNSTAADPEIPADPEVPATAEKTTDVDEAVEFSSCEEMPADSDISEAGDGTVIKASWDEGVFPAGTTVLLESKSSAEAEALGQLALGNDYNLTGAFAVDITFENAENDEEIQPFASSEIQITLELPETLLGDSFYLVHQKESGELEFLINAVVSVERLNNGSMSATSVHFNASSFSVYALLAEGQSGPQARRTYRYYVDDTLYYSQSLTQGDTLEDPGIPDLQDNEEFIGWYRTGDASQTPVSIDSLREELKTAEIYEGEIVSFTALISHAHTVTFQDENQNRLKTVKVYDGENYKVTEIIRAENAESIFRGWLLDGEVVSVGDTIENITSDLLLSPVMNRLFRLSFCPNNDDDSELNLPAVMAEEGTELLNWLPGAEEMTRHGYKFAGWYRGHETDGAVTLDGERITDGIVTKEETFYASWIPAENTAFTVKIWKQSLEDDYRIGLTQDSPYYDINNDFSSDVKHYELERIVRLQGTTGAGVSTAEGYAELLSPNRGFILSKEEVLDGKGTESALIDASGNTVVNLYFDRQIMVLTLADAEVQEYVENTEQTEKVFGTDGDSWFPIYCLETDGYVRAEEYAEDENYYGTDDGANFFRIWYSENAVSFKEASDNGAIYRLSDDGLTYERVYRVNGVWRLGNSSDSEEYSGTRYKAGSSKALWIRTSNSSCSVAYTGDRYNHGKVFDWYKENSAEGEKYTGTRFVCKTGSQDIVFIGLFGQPFEQYQYTWPQNYVPAEAVFTDEFTDADLFPETAENGTVRTGVVNPALVSPEAEKITVHYYTRTGDGSYEERAVSTCYLEETSEYSVHNPFSGLTVADYAWSGSAETPDVEDFWHTGEVSADGTILCVGRGEQTHLHLHYLPLPCRLVFTDGVRQGDEGELSVLTIPFGDSLSDYQTKQPEIPAREGYVFTGWFLDPYGMEAFQWKGKMSSAELTVYAGWEKCNYRVVVNLCDDVDSPATYGPGQSFLIPDAGTIPDVTPSRPGFQFLGFYTDPACLNEFPISRSLGSSITAIDLNYPESDEYANGLEEAGDLIHGAEQDCDYVAGKLQLYAGWEKQITYSLFLRYDADGGSGAPSDDTDYFGQEYVAAHGTCTAPEGKAFLCWTYQNTESGKETDVYPGHYFSVKQADKLEEDKDDLIIYTVTLKAKYVEKQLQDFVTVTFKANGGDNDYVFEVRPNELFVIPDAETAGVSRNGYRLIGWNTEDDGSGDRFIPGETAAANSRGANTLYAEWEKLFYTVSFSLNTDEAGTAPNDQKVFFGKTATRPENPERQGYRFTGWSLGDSPYNFDSPVTENQTLTAQWRREYRVTYLILSDSGPELTGAPIESQGFLPGETVQLKPEPQPLTGYQDFRGWFIDGELVQDGKFAMPEENVLVYGSFKPVSYSIHYNLDGGSIEDSNPASYTVEDEVRVLSAPKKTGYIFSGWTEASGTVPQKSITIPKGSTGDKFYTAVWEPAADTRYSVTVHYPVDWDLPASIPNATVDLDLKTVNYSCVGTTDSLVTAQAFQNQDDRRLSLDENHDGSLLKGIVQPDGSLALHVFLKKTEYRYAFEFYLKGTERVLSTCSGTVFPDENGTAAVEASLDEVVFKDPYPDYLKRMTIEGDPVHTITRDNAVIRIPVVIIVSIDRIDSRESFNNGEEQNGYSYNELTGSSFTTVSSDQHMAVSGLLPGDGLIISMTPAKGKDPGTYQASFENAAFIHDAAPVSYYRFTGFDPAAMGKLNVLKTVCVIWMNGKEELFTDPYVPPGTVPEYRGETPRMDSDLRYDYTFTGWDPAVGKATKDVTRYDAVFSKSFRSYTVKWLNEDGTILRTDTYKYGEKPSAGGITPQKTEDREYSYSFKGWSPAVEDVCKDAEYRAVFERSPQKYKITYYVDGKQDGISQMFSFGETVSLRQIPAKEGFTFAGWSSEKITPDDGKIVMPAEDVVFSGRFVLTPKEDFDAGRLSGVQKPTAKTGLRYTGEFQSLLDTVQEMPEDFSLLRFSIDNGNTWSSQIPEGKNVGTYTILAEYSGSKKYNSFCLDPLAVAIRKGEIPEIQLLIRGESIYNGTRQSFLTSIPELPEEVSIEYKVLTPDDQLISDWSASLPGAVKPGRYKVCYRINGGDNYNSISQTWADNGSQCYAVIKKAEQLPPSVKPRATFSDKGAVTILQAVSGQEYAVKLRGEIPSEEDWILCSAAPEETYSLTLAQLTPGSEVVVFTRKAESDCYNASDCIASEPVKIPKESQDQPADKPDASAGITTITVDPASPDQEYKLEDITDWTPVPKGKTALTFYGLTPDTDYRLTTRMAETATKAASAPGDSVTIHTADEALFTEVRRQNNTVPEITADGLTSAFAKSLLSAEEKRQLQQGKTVSVFLMASDITETITAAEKQLVTKKADSIAGNPVIWMYMDLSLMKQTEDQAPVSITEIGDNDLVIKLALADRVRNTDEKLKRTFQIVAVHNGNTELVTPTVGANSLEFSIGSFSTFAFLYTDQKLETPVNDESEPASGSANLPAVSGNTGTSSTPTTASVVSTGLESGPSAENNTLLTVEDNMTSGAGTSSAEKSSGHESTEKTSEDMQSDDILYTGKWPNSAEAEENGFDNAIKHYSVRILIPLLLLFLFLFFPRRKKKEADREKYPNLKGTELPGTSPDS